MLYTAQAVANWFIQKSLDTKTPVDQLKLMKLVYIAQGIGLASDNPLFKEPIQAWKYGPVIKTLYHDFKKFGLNPITEFACKDGERPPIIPSSDTNAIKILETTWNAFSCFEGTQLSNWSHSEDGPWYKEWFGGKNRQKNHTIDNSLISKYFGEMISNV